MSDPLYVNEQVEIPGAELIVRTSRSTGAGGQHANVTDSRVEVSFDVASSSSLPEWARLRLLERLGPRVSAVAQDERSQLRNREIARSRLAERLRSALERPRVRRPTRPGPAARERRLDSKRRQSQRKQARRPPPEE
jgi:ribosome-associated protein